MKERKKKIPNQKIKKNEAPDFSEANWTVTVNGKWDSAKQIIGLSVKFHPVQVDNEKSTVRILTGPEDEE